MFYERVTRLLIKTKIVDTKAYPKIMREYFFASGLLRYAKRKAFLPSEWRKKLKKAPSLLGLNVTDVCNARCVYCAYRFHKPEGVMDMATYEKAICEFAGMGGGVRWVYPI